MYETARAGAMKDATSDPEWMLWIYLIVAIAMIGGLFAIVLEWMSRSS